MINANESNEDLEDFFFESVMGIICLPERVNITVLIMNLRTS